MCPPRSVVSAEGLRSCGRTYVSQQWCKGLDRCAVPRWARCASLGRWWYRENLNRSPKPSCENGLRRVLMRWQARRADGVSALPELDRCAVPRWVRCAPLRRWWYRAKLTRSPKLSCENGLRRVLMQWQARRADGVSALPDVPSIYCSCTARRLSERWVPLHPAISRNIYTILKPNCLISYRNAAARTVVRFLR